MPCNDTYVCFDCRRSARSSRYGKVLCPVCGKAMTGIGQHWQAPKRKDTKGWRDLEKLAAKLMKRYGHTRL